MKTEFLTSTLYAALSAFSAFLVLVAGPVRAQPPASQAGAAAAAAASSATDVNVTTKASAANYTQQSTNQLQGQSTIVSPLTSTSSNTSGGVKNNLNGFLFNPAVLPTALAAPNTFQFRAGGVEFSCPVRAHGGGVSLYIVAWNYSSSSGEVSDYCKSLAEWAKTNNKLIEIKLFMGDLDPAQRPAYAAKIIQFLGQSIGIDLNVANMTTAKSTQIRYVPYVPRNGKTVPPVHSSN